AAVLAGALIIMVINEVATLAIHPTYPETNAYAIETGAGASSEEASKDVVEGPSLGALLATADIGKGKKVFSKCKSCHTADEGGANKIGPNLHAVLNRDKASHEGFSYSTPMANMGGNWSYSDLDLFLKKPSTYIKGTKMTFGGLKKPQDRAHLIAYLRSLGTEDVPLPPAN
ncbi:MAG: cytochrome c family protein, partial [Sneathiella sp.]